MLPEFGVGYIKNVRFFEKDQEPRVTDLIVAACKLKKYLNRT